MKTTASSSVRVLLVLGVLATFLALLSSARAAANIILFIGDGMGPDHVKAARVLVNGSSASALGFEQLGYSAQAITVLPGGTVTDSATAATALATGYQHPANGVVSMGANASIKTTVLELAKAKGFRTGIITTDDIGGATPGAFGAHEPDRTFMAAIRYDYLTYDSTYAHPASLPGLLLGGGYDDPALVRGTGLPYKGLATSLGYSFVSTSSGLSEASSLPLLGLFGTSWAPMASMLSRPADQPRLSEMVVKALDLLANEAGFFLMVESANIDKLSHSNDRNFVWEVSELDAAVQAAVGWMRAHAADNTLIVVAADHETGGLSVPDQTATPGTVPSMTWTTTGHSARNVPVFTTWPLSLNNLTVDNTEIFFLLEDYLNTSSGGKPPVLTGLTVLGLTETSATVQWDTVEPSSTALRSGENLLSEDNARVTRHTVVCSGLAPATQYSLTATSTDIAGNTGTADVSFSTKPVDFTARVLAEPVVTVGAVSGTVAGVAAPADGASQSVTEAASGVGSRVLVEYTLHTAASRESIDTLTLQGLVGWTGKDGTLDELIAEVRLALPGGGYGWQKIAFPFQAVPPSAYVDSNGDIAVRFSDSASVKRERKDTLTVDYLAGEVALGNTTPTPPTTPGTPMASEPTAGSVTFTWTDAAYETGYLIWRYDVESGWVVLAEEPANATAFSDNRGTSGMSYTYVVRAINADGYADSDPLSVQMPVFLLAPTNVKASATKGAIHLTWSDINTIETGYEILRGTTADGNFEHLGSVSADAISFSDQTTVRGTKYYYQVRAVKDGQAGPVSLTVAATAR